MRKNIFICSNFYFFVVPVPVSGTKLWIRMQIILNRIGTLFLFYFYEIGIVDYPFISVVSDPDPRKYFALLLPKSFYNW